MRVHVIFQMSIVVPPTIPPPVIDVQLKPPSTTSNPSLMLPSYYCDRKLAQTLTDAKSRSYQADLDAWVKHYQAELHEMYETCVDKSLKVSWDVFVRAMYESTAETFDQGQFKWARPLL